MWSRWACAWGPTYGYMCVNGVLNNMEWAITVGERSMSRLQRIGKSIWKIVANVFTYELFQDGRNANVSGSPRWHLNCNLTEWLILADEPVMPNWIDIRFKSNNFFNLQICLRSSFQLTPIGELFLAFYPVSQHIVPVRIEAYCQWWRVLVYALHMGLMSRGSAIRAMCWE